MNPRPIAVQPLKNFELEIKFANGEVRIFDMKPHLEFGVFNELKSVSYFNQVKIQNGSVAWPNEQDVCPDTLFEGSRLLRKNGAA